MNHRSIFSASFVSLTVALAASAITGCSSSSDDSSTFNSAVTAGFDCHTKGPCDGDPEPSAKQASACDALVEDAQCGAAFLAYSRCAYDYPVCSDAGMSDSTADSTSASCSNAYATYTTCLGNKMVDAGASN